MTFSGSYSADDVTFLINPVDIQLTDVNQKETLIQTGQAHYSDMLSFEQAPSDEHISLFNKAFNAGAPRLAVETLSLAKSIVHDQMMAPEIVLVSLVRAGVPLGVLLKRTIQSLTNKPVFHYGVSIIRDRGLDHSAMLEIESKHQRSNIIFVDGWTGKGAISGELSRSLSERGGYPTPPKLAVLADPGGCAWLAASGDDWLIPSGILGATVSGLISRTLWRDHGYHGAKLWNHLSDLDVSQEFVDKIYTLIRKLDAANIPACVWLDQERIKKHKQSQQAIETLQNEFKIKNINRIKPGIAEATRAVMRRVPEHVLVRDKKDPDVALLCYLAEKNNVNIQAVGDKLGGYRAITIIKKVN
ncbi:cysteine protease StiP family protein [Gayadomonas joobiniege]|uniref:cysteine protease StiP family protein n=1 Tax=Gayadomonas joobiniege TaxID=1234606 RepID=UPI00036CAE25|nr:cysteine protease StiP family protein [Gayadomonas joobiniege]